MMLSRIAVETVTAGTTPVPLMMFEMGTLPGGTSPMSSNAAAALDAPHSAAAGHLNRRLDLNRLLSAVCPKFAVS
jgi:hypothetical protein